MTKTSDTLLDRRWILCIALIVSLTGVVLYCLSFRSELIGKSLNEATLKFLFETVKVMLPIVTGYLVLVVGAISNIWKTRLVDFDKFDSRRIKESMVLGIFSLGMWSGVMAFCIHATRTYKGLYVWGAMLCAQAGHVLFFLSIVIALRFFYLLIFAKKPNVTTRPN